jgi:hypothetical protein
MRESRRSRIPNRMLPRPSADRAVTDDSAVNEIAFDLVQKHRPQGVAFPITTGN